MFSHKDVLPSGRILVFMITLGKTFFHLSVSTFIIASEVSHDKQITVRYRFQSEFETYAEVLEQCRNM